jgi:transposase
MEPRKHYTKAFKLDAISLVVDQGFTIAEAARNLEIRANESPSAKQNIVKRNH